MVKKIIFIGLGVFLLLIICIRISTYIGKNYHKDIKNNPKKYAYHPKIKNAVYLLTDIKYAEQYIQYYKNITKNNFDMTVDFPLKAIPLNNEVYILDHNVDSLVIHVACHYKTQSGEFTKFLKAYAYKEILHDVPYQESIENNTEN